MHHHFTNLDDRLKFVHISIEGPALFKHPEIFSLLSDTLHTVLVFSHSFHFFYSESCSDDQVSLITSSNTHLQLQRHNPLSMLLVIATALGES